MAEFEIQNPGFEVEVRESFGRLTLMRTIGARLLRVAPGAIEIDLPFREDLTQHHGFVAAAVLTAIVDVACGYAAMTLMPAGSTVLTVEYKANFVAPAQGDRMLARARVLKPGRNVTVCAGDVYAVVGSEETLAATMLATMMRVSEVRGVSAVERSVRQSVPARVHRRRRSWCTCGGRGVRRALRGIAGLEA
jgi:uncharacterized protein (TIGR00369 family)